MADTKGQGKGLSVRRNRGDLDGVVLEKAVFSSVFDKDIRRVYIYKKAERLAKAIHLIAPAFRNSRAMRDRLDRIAIELVDAAVQAPAEARERLSRELLALSSVLAIAQSGGMLSTMNAELISDETHHLLEEVANYEEPRVTLADTPSIATLAREAGAQRAASQAVRSHGETRTTERPVSDRRTESKGQSQGHLSDRGIERREAILSVLKSKGPSYIKDISTVIRDVSEKTVQRELQTLVESGEIIKSGERRWTMYSLAQD